MSRIKKVSLLITCLADAYFPQVGQSMVYLLKRCGLIVDFPPEQVCCGQPAFNTGYPDEARKVASGLVRALSRSAAVVSPSGSCVHMIRHHYPELFTGTPLQTEAEALAGKTFEFSEYLVKVLGIDDLGASYDGIVTYHQSCHLSRGLGVVDEPRRLLRQVRGLELVELTRPEECCGFGGTFSVKVAPVSLAMADDKIADIRETGARAVVGSDLGCLMHLAGRMSRLGIRVPAVHLAEFLAGGVRP